MNGTTENYRGNGQTALLVSSSTQTDNEDLEYLDMNFKYPFSTKSVPQSSLFSLDIARYIWL